MLDHVRDCVVFGCYPRTCAVVAPVEADVQITDDDCAVAVHKTSEVDRTKSFFDIK